MENVYPTNLIERIIRYFKERYGHDISPATAIEYLNSFADLHGSFIEFLECNEHKEEVLPDSTRI